MRELTFGRFKRNGKEWMLISSNDKWEDEWKCKETLEIVKCNRANLLRWVQQGHIKPISTEWVNTKS